MQVLRLSSMIGSVLFAMACGSAQAPATPVGSPLLVVVNAKNPVESLSEGRVASLFRGQSRYWDGGVAVRPILLPNSEPSSGEFFRRVMDTTYSQFHRKWSSRQLSGGGFAPRTAPTAGAMLQEVAANSGGIGYILTEDFEKLPHPGVKAITLVP